MLGHILSQSVIWSFLEPLDKFHLSLTDKVCLSESPLKGIGLHAILQQQVACFRGIHPLTLEINNVWRPPTGVVKRKKLIYNNIYLQMQQQIKLPIDAVGAVVVNNVEYDFLSLLLSVFGYDIPWYPTLKRDVEVFLERADMITAPFKQDIADQLLFICNNDITSNISLSFISSPQSFMELENDFFASQPSWVSRDEPSWLHLHMAYPGKYNPIDGWSWIFRRIIQVYIKDFAVFKSDFYSDISHLKIEYRRLLPSRYILSNWFSQSQQAIQ